jgi:branched-chain amino acid transport system substrate-binding protein
MKKIIAFIFVLLAMASAHAEDIEIGGLFETSGFAASLGQPALDGAMLAVEEVNAAGGINGRHVDLTNVNSESDNTKTVSGMRRLITQDHVVALLGPLSSGSSFAIVDAVERAKVPMVTGGATRAIVLPEDKKTYTFLSPLTDAVAQVAMLQDMKRKGISRIALLNSDVAFGTSGRSALESAVKDYGVTIVDEETFGNSDTDMSPQLTKIRGSNAQATVVWATGAGLANSTKNYRALGIKEPLYLSHAANDFNYLRLAGDSADGILVPSTKLYVAASLPDRDPQKAVITQFVNAYKSRYGKPPATFAGNGYDAAKLVMNAIRSVGTDPAAIRQAIEQTKDYVGVTAVYNYSATDHFGIASENVVMLTVRGDQFVLANK